MNRIEKEFYVKKKKRKTDPVLLVEIFNKHLHEEYIIMTGFFHPS